MSSLQYLLNLVYLFFIYSIIGWLIEVTLKYFQFHRFINRGFLTGPWLPIYGSGCALITVAIDALTLLSVVNSSYGSVFAVSFALCGTLEYMVSYVMEKRFHARWWDYSTKPMNLHGRVWIGNLILFGLGGVLVVKLASPVFLNLLGKIPQNMRITVACGLTSVFTADVIISHFVLKMVKTEVEGSEADNTEEISKEVRATLSDRNLFARRFALAYPEVIYRTDKVKARLASIMEQTEALRKEAELFIADRKESSTHIRNTVISDQNTLIEMLYDENNSDEKQKSLKEKIDVNMERLKDRGAL